MSDVVMTPDGLERLVTRLAQLRATRDVLMEQLTRALEHGGATAENGEFLAVRQEQGILERRIEQLEERLDGATLARPQADGEVDVGERVTVRDVATGETTTYRIVGSGESDPAAGDVSHQSPVGAALLGRRAGDVVEADAPRGRLRLEVVAVDG